MRLSCRVAGALLAVAVAALAPVRGAAGQDVLAPAITGGPSGYTPISVSELDGYCRMLGFDREQAELAGMLLEGYQEAVRAAQGESRRLKEEAGRQRDHEARVKALQESTSSYRARAEELEQLFLDDVEALMASDEQRAQWPRVERARQRERQIRRGPVSTAQVDVIKLIAGVTQGGAKGGAEGGEWVANAPVRDILDRYEAQLDALLAERARAGANLEGINGALDAARVEAINKAVGRRRELSLGIRALNDAVVAELLGLTPPEERDTLELAYQRAKFPRIYRESHASRLLAAAAELDDLSEAQRRAIAALWEQHDAQAASLNSRWARELAEAERTGEESAGAHFFLASAGEPEETALARASRARRELDAATEVRLRELLDDAQIRRLPEREPEPAEQWTGDGEVILIR